MPTRAHSTRRAVVAATVGSTIEFYDFLLYGVLAALVFPKVFFPHANPYAGVLLSFSTYFIGFCARPIGAVIFGHFGDRIGRKRTLVLTMLTMGVGTVGVGLIPSYDAIGAAGGFLLVAGRVLQGIGVGGEWAGANLLATESGSSRHRGFLTSFPQAGAMLGLAAANLAVFTVTTSLSGPAFLSWGWRIPFLAGAALFGLGLWLRSRVAETAEFEQIVASGAVLQRPLVAAARRQPVEITLCLFMKVAEMVPVYVFSAFVLAYGTHTLHLSRSYLLLCVAAAALLAVVAMPLVGRWSDQAGHERVFRLGAAAMVLFAFVYAAALETANGTFIGAVIVASLLPYAVMYGVEGAIFAKSFRPEWRYSGSSLAFNLAGIIGGGPAPLVATWLIARTGSPFAIGAYIALAGAIGMVAATAMLRRNRPLAASRDVETRSASAVPVTVAAVSS